MKKLIINYLILFSFCLLNAEIVNPDPFNFINYEYTTYESYEQPFVIFYHKDLIVKTYENNEREIIYENPKRYSGIENTRDTLLRIHFNDTDPNFIIINEDHVFSEWDATWINATTAEITMPSGIFKIYSYFSVESLWKMVIRYNVDLTFGTGLHEIWIDHNEATNILELNSCDINGVPFDMSEKYYSNFHFHLLDENFGFTFTHTYSNQFVTTDFAENFNFVASELKFDEENIHVSQYGPIQEITSSQSFSNEPTDYCSQQILLQIPEVNEDPKIGVTNTNWFATTGFTFYDSSMNLNDLFECYEDQWSINLYMMNHNYDDCGSTTRIYLGYLEDDNFEKIYSTAPFHCLDDKIGSFWNSIPIIVDYLSPDGEQLIFGQSPIYIELWHEYFNNMLCPWFELCGSDNVQRSFDLYNSTFTLTDSFGNVQAEGELTDMLNLNVPEDIYTLNVKDNNFSLAGLPGTCTLTNCFNTALELPNPPFINSLTIFNEDNEPVNQLEYNENATLLFSVADVEYIDNLNVYFPVITDSVKVFCKLHEEEDWQEIETEFIDDFPEIGWTFGKVFSTDLSATTIIDSVAYDLKIHFEDNEENYTELILEPAFIVGDFDATSLSEDEIQKPEIILSNYPNPFNPETNIVFNLPEEGDVQLDIYNIKGQKVDQLEITNYELGINEVTWDAKRFASGIYMYQLIVDGKAIASKKCLLLK